MDTQTRVTEVAPGIHQLTTVIPAAPVAFNQYLIAAAEPLLFHTGMRGLFPLVAAGVSTVVAPETLRWVSFGHVEADESGSMNEWLALAPQASVAHGFIGCMVSIGDLADRPPRALADGETMDIGGHVVQWFDTPHVPHACRSPARCALVEPIERIAVGGVVDFPLPRWKIHHTPSHFARFNIWLRKRTDL